MTNELDTLATALYVKTDDLPKSSPYLARWRPAVGITPKLTGAELVTLAVMRALLGVHPGIAVAAARPRPPGALPAAAAGL